MLCLPLTAPSRAPTAYMSIAVAPGGQKVEISTPLPHVEGVVSLELPISATVADLKAAVARAQGSRAPAVSSLTVVTSSGDVVAASSQLRLFLEDDFVVKVDGLTLTPVFDAVADLAMGTSTTIINRDRVTNSLRPHAASPVHCAGVGNRF